MIELTKLNNEVFGLNVMLIERVDALTEPAIILSNGKVYRVRNSFEEVMEKIKHVQHEIYDGGETT